MSEVVPTFKRISDSFDKTVNSALGFIGKDNSYVSAALSIVLIVYASLAAPKLPQSIAKLFDYAWFKIIVFFLIALTARHQPTVAIIAAVAVLISLQTLNLYKVNSEMMAIVTADEDKLGKDGVPVYTYSIHNTAPSSNYPQPVPAESRREDPRANRLTQKDELPITQVPDEELRSLCQKMFVNDERTRFEGISTSNLAEMVNAQNACKIATHQFDVPSSAVPHTAQVKAFDPNE